MGDGWAMADTLGRPAPRAAGPKVPAIWRRPRGARFWAARSPVRPHLARPPGKPVRQGGDSLDTVV